MKELFKLRHSYKPYAGFVIIYLILMVVFASISFQKSDWSVFSQIVVPLAVIFTSMVLFLLFLNNRYQVFLEDSVITMRAASLTNNPRAFTSIKIEDITKIKSEVSDLHTTVKLRRPFRRIAVYDDRHEKFIDISLKHFVMEDIIQLLKVIKEKRPDLEVPLI